MLRPPDIVVLLALLRQGDEPWTVRSLAEGLHMPLAAVQRSLARLGDTPAFDGAGRRASAGASDALIAHALPFVAPGSLGAPVRGIPTAWGATPLADEVAGGVDAPVWPDRRGTARGPALTPLHECALALAREDREMYEALALVDALRVGPCPRTQARTRSPARPVAQPGGTLVSIHLLERAAAALGPLLDEVVFVGGATIDLWITDPAAPPPRPTLDVDVVVEVTTRLGYEGFGERMRARGFNEDATSHMICRWRHAATELVLDAMPADPSILGFANRWQSAAIPHAAHRSLPSAATIRAATPPYLDATKLEAFAGRGGGDLLASHDFEDVVALLDGRDELVAEIQAAPPELRAFVGGRLGTIRDHPRVLDALYGWLPSDDESQSRATDVLLQRIDTLIASA